MTIDREIIKFSTKEKKYLNFKEKSLVSLRSVTTRASWIFLTKLTDLDRDKFETSWWSFFRIQFFYLFIFGSKFCSLGFHMKFSF